MVGRGGNRGGGRRKKKEKGKVKRGEEKGKGQRVHANEGIWVKAVGNVREKGHIIMRRAKDGLESRKVYMDRSIG